MTIFAGDADGQIYSSETGDIGSWVTRGTAGSRVDYMQQFRRYLYAAGDAVYRSVDGDTWEKVVTFDGTAYATGMVLFKGALYVLASPESDIVKLYRTYDGEMWATTWSCSAVYGGSRDLQADGDYIYLSILQADYSTPNHPTDMLHSTDGSNFAFAWGDTVRFYWDTAHWNGAYWGVTTISGVTYLITSATGGSDNYSVVQEQPYGTFFWFTDGQALYLAGEWEPSHYGQILRTTDGATWTNVYTGSTYGKLIRVCCNTGYGVLYAASYEGVFRSVDNGETWTQVLVQDGITAVSTVGQSSPWWFMI